MNIYSKKSRSERILILESNGLLTLRIWITKFRVYYTVIKILNGHLLHKNLLDCGGFGA